MSENKDVAEDLGSSHCSTALLPCPFCGCKDIDPKFWKNNEGDVGPGCSECGATTETNEAWNTRKSLGSIEHFIDREIESMDESGRWSTHAIDALLGLQSRIDLKLTEQGSRSQ